ncbi:MAG: DUF4214 domain-containing protein [Candidatus Bathyarchaeia archaeon]
MVEEAMGAGDFLIVYGQITYDEEFNGTKRCVEEMAPYVDYCVIVCEKQRPFSEEQKKELLKYPNVILLEEPYNDNHPEFRNIYLNKARELGKQRGKPVWMCVSDSDEYYSEELRRNLRSIIAEYDSKGVNQLGIRCLEQFEVHDWMDEIDKLKEAPTIARQSTYYKLLIFKICCDQLRYEGIGVEKRVHETWGCPIHPWVPAHLPPNLTYTHVKPCIKTWRNSARNVFIAGGGNNLGDRVPLWVELRAICNALGINSWREFEAYLKKGNVDVLLKKFLVKCLDAPRTDWGVEYREASLYYWALHPNEITPEILHKIKNPPKATVEEETEWYVVSMYRQILGREPDDAGRMHYTQALLMGEITREQLPAILMASDEYRIKFNVDEVTQWVIKCYAEVLKRPPDESGLRAYVDHIVKGRIKKDELPDILRSSEEYRQKFGSA